MKTTPLTIVPDCGSTWKKIIFADGNYSYEGLNDYINQTLENNDDEKRKIEIWFIQSQYKVLVSLSAGYQLDLRGSKFGELVGFEEKLITQEKIGSKLPNITNSTDMIYLNTDRCNQWFVGGWKDSNTLAMIPTDNINRSLSFTVHPPINWLFNPVSSNIIKSMLFFLRGHFESSNKSEWNRMVSLN